MPRGGKRPGAGAPKHNFNALKNGMSSDRMRRIGAILLRHPLFRLIYKRIRANLAKQILSSQTVRAGLRACPPPRGFVAVFVDGKCRHLYLAPKNKSNQSNFVFFIYTQNWGQEKSIIQSPTTDTHRHPGGGKSPWPPLRKGGVPMSRDGGFRSCRGIAQHNKLNKLSHPFPCWEGAGG